MKDPLEEVYKWMAERRKGNEELSVKDYNVAVRKATQVWTKTIT